MFAKKYGHIVQELKSLVQTLPRDSFRFQKSVSKYGGITVNLYMKDVDSFRAVAHGLKEKDLFINTMLEEKKVFPRDLISMAQEACQERSIMR